MWTSPKEINFIAIYGGLRDRCRIERGEGQKVAGSVSRVLSQYTNYGKYIWFEKFKAFRIESTLKLVWLVGFHTKGWTKIFFFKLI
jgi:hypothetical protein